MTLPFTNEAFFAVFAAYNRAVWPAQAAAYVLGAATVALALRPAWQGGRAVWGALGLFWLWTGVAYHWMHFAAINRAAWGFGLLFVVQGTLFLAVGAARERPAIRFRPDAAGWLGAALVAYAMLVYPILGHTLGHGWPRAPLFGVAPCPTTIFTAGVVLWAGDVPRRLLAIPLLWSLIGASAAWLLGVPEDLGLLAAAAALSWRLAAPRKAPPTALGPG